MKHIHHLHFAIPRPFAISRTFPKLPTTDVAPYGDFLFAIVDGTLHLFRYKDGPLEICPSSPSIFLQDLGVIGSFTNTKVIEADEAQQVLVAAISCGGALQLFDLPDPGSALDPTTISGTDITMSGNAASLQRVESPAITDLEVAGDTILVADRRNGLYLFSLEAMSYTGFYPAHRNDEVNRQQWGWFAPALVRSPEGVVPLFGAYSVTTVEDRIMVKEDCSGRVAILAVKD